MASLAGIVSQSGKIDTAATEQVRKMLELFHDKVEVTKVTRLYARYEGEGCPCTKMKFTLDYCPQDVLIVGTMVGFAQRTLDNSDIFGDHKTCARSDEDKNVCVYELRKKEEGVPTPPTPGMPT